MKHVILALSYVVTLTIQLLKRVLLKTLGLEIFESNFSSNLKRITILSTDKVNTIYRKILNSVFLFFFKFRLNVVFCSCLSWG